MVPQRQNGAEQLNKRLVSAFGLLRADSLQTAQQAPLFAVSMPYFEQTRSEEMFCTEAEAQVAGYRRAIFRQ